MDEVQGLIRFYLAARTPVFDALLFVKKKSTKDNSLFAGMPADVRRLEKQARKELRLKKRLEWKNANLSG